jgi:hypothetical protein
MKLYMLYNNERVPEARPNSGLRRTVIYPFQTKLSGREITLRPSVPVYTLQGYCSYAPSLRDEF